MANEKFADINIKLFDGNTQDISQIDYCLQQKIGYVVILKVKNLEQYEIHSVQQQNVFRCEQQDNKGAVTSCFFHDCELLIANWILLSQNQRPIHPISIVIYQDCKLRNIMYVCIIKLASIESLLNSIQIIV
jgi:hypothetical protein